MKTSFKLATVLLAASPAWAGLIPSNGVLPGTPGRRDLRPAEGRSEPPKCNQDNVLRALQNPTRSVSATSFCSAFLEPTVTATISQTEVITATSIITESTTISVVETVIAAAVATCAASPTSGTTTCNYPAFGFSSYLISQYAGQDPVTCHELCLADPSCKSFQTQSGGAQFCNLFNTPTAGFVQYAPGQGFTMFDRDCPQYLPAQCAPGYVGKRDVERRVVTTPANLLTVLATVPASRISSACKCLFTYTSAIIGTVSASVTVSTSTTTTVLTTTTGTEIDNIITTVTLIVTAAP